MKLAMLEKQSVPEKLKQTIVSKEEKQGGMMRDMGLLILRLVMGGLLVGHGSQKLFGWVSGPGRFSLDRVFGIRLPRGLVIAVAVVEAVALAYGILSRPETAPAPTSKDEVDTAVETGKGTR